MATGLGKSYIALMCCLIHLKKYPNDNILWISHRNDIIDSQKKLFNKYSDVFIVLTHGNKIKEINKMQLIKGKIFVILRQSLKNDLFPNNTINGIIYDECHDASKISESDKEGNIINGKTYDILINLEKNNQLKYRIGFSATPLTSNKQQNYGICKLYGENNKINYLYKMSMVEGVNLGFLLKPCLKYLSFNSKSNVENIKNFYASYDKNKNILDTIIIWIEKIINNMVYKKGICWFPNQEMQLFFYKIIKDKFGKINVYYSTATYSENDTVFAECENNALMIACQKFTTGFDGRNCEFGINFVLDEMGHQIIQKIGRFTRLKDKDKQKYAYFYQICNSSKTELNRIVSNIVGNLRTIEFDPDDYNKKVSSIQKNVDYKVKSDDIINVEFINEEINFDVLSEEINKFINSDNNSSNNENYNCKLCVYEATTLFNYNRHLKSKKHISVMNGSINDGPKQYKCNIYECDYSTYTKFCFDRHLLKHTNKHQYECIVCSMKFVQKSDFDIHIKTLRHAKKLQKKDPECITRGKVNIFGNNVPYEDRGEVNPFKEDKYLKYPKNTKKICKKECKKIGVKDNNELKHDLYVEYAGYKGQINKLNRFLEIEIDENSETKIFKDIDDLINKLNKLLKAKENNKNCKPKILKDPKKVKEGSKKEVENKKIIHDLYVEISEYTSKIEGLNILLKEETGEKCKIKIFKDIYDLINKLNILLLKSNGIDEIYTKKILVNIKYLINGLNKLLKVKETDETYKTKILKDIDDLQNKISNNSKEIRKLKENTQINTENIVEKKKNKDITYHCIMCDKKFNSRKDANSHVKTKVHLDILSEKGIIVKSESYSSPKITCEKNKTINNAKINNTKTNNTKEWRKLMADWAGYKAKIKTLNKDLITKDAELYEYEKDDIKIQINDYENKLNTIRDEISIIKELMKKDKENGIIDSESEDSDDNEKSEEDKDAKSDNNESNNNESNNNESDNNESDNNESDNNESNNNESDNNESDNNESDNNESYSNESDNNESDNNESDNNESDNNESDSNESESDESDNNESDSNESDSNESDNNESDNNESDNNESDNNKSDNNESDSNECESDESDSNESESDESESDESESDE
jgi:hypothetical protein